jgi:hypothetical protein
MAKGKEKAPLGEIERRLGKNALIDGERTRPYYLGELVNLHTDRDNNIRRRSFNSKSEKKEGI